MAQHSSSSRGCGCGNGGSFRPQLPPTPPDPCAGGLASVARAQESSCGCGKQTCSCKSRALTAPPTRTYDSEACPTFAISCETKQALRDCVKVAFCDFLRCASETLCPDGRFDLAQLSERKELQSDIINCVGQLACSFMHCVPEALCPDACETEAPADCLPCDYAVEVLR